MRSRSLIAGLVAAVCCAVGRADAPVPVPPLTLPPIGDDPATAFPNGTPVSQPLRPVGTPELVPPAAPPPVVDEKVADAESVPPLPASWEKLELLFWWAKAHPLPPLVTTSRVPVTPALGGANTTLLVGGHALDTQDAAGGRFTLGWAVNDDRTIGVEATYFFLGTRTYRQTVSDIGHPRYPVLGRPFRDANTGREDAVLVTFPGAGTGQVNVSTTTRVTGWEVGGVANLLAGPRARLTALFGYRYFMANEGLRIEQTSVRFATPANPTIQAEVADQIDAHNRFHGGQLGLSADVSRGGVFVELVGKVALGQTIEVVRVSGLSKVITAGNPLPLIQTFDAGVLGLPSNAGRVARSAFAVLPEAQLKLGYRFADRSRVYVGYNFIYLSDAVRPGDQVDRTLNPARVPLLPGPPAAAAPAGPDRSELVVNRTDFWVQGVVVGLEYRY